MSNIKLTQAQHAVLDYAINNTNGKIVWFPDKVKGGARQKVINGMFSRALITPNGPDWFVAFEGYEALGMVHKVPTVAPTSAPTVATDTTVAPSVADPDLEATVAACEASMATPGAQSMPRSRANSKQAAVLAMLRRPEGATVQQICQATGWQAHTVRGTFAGAFKKKLGLTITSVKPQGGERSYHLGA